MFTSLVFSMPPQHIMSLEVFCGQTVMDGLSPLLTHGAILQVGKHVGLAGINQAFIFFPSFLEPVNIGLLSISQSIPYRNSFTFWGYMFICFFCLAVDEKIDSTQGKHEATAREPSA